MCSVMQCGGLLFLTTPSKVIVVPDDAVGAQLNAALEGTEGAKGTRAAAMGQLAIDDVPTAATVKSKPATGSVLLAVTTAKKTLYICEVQQFGATIKITTTQQTRVEKRSTKLVFSSLDTLLSADKFGDVHKFSFATSSEDAEDEGADASKTSDPICGHVSMLLDLDVQADQLRTADRDGKIRISRLPDAFCIDAFCLGHTEFVSAITGTADCVVSGSGDGTIRVWNAADGSQLASHNICEVLSLAKADRESVVPTSLFLVARQVLIFILNKSPVVHVWTMTADLTAVTATANLAVGGHISSCWCDAATPSAASAAHLWCVVERDGGRQALVMVEVTNDTAAQPRVVTDELMPASLELAQPVLDLTELFHDNASTSDLYFARKEKRLEAKRTKQPAPSTAAKKSKKR
ncbi:hypothetical protein PTSG_09341 [Salpingoeca rosetta]|uniref:Uncharacterized protein n=1 Tax=Salpingoeca rosetta (strain ATCC 50818 / BSB-021) TaxID=946362 RepID=F2UMC8_SALR5|nr:uncharacterized protein PTSG_09341 [Salpingoeca rosetta]EGD78277.1 hypothetical protein PTSG_09341 [Salpingoeca rosetta]|eukprot:XP_004989600.1 hypothetical protein PTSG_09341 [Salpingoeca rosetta]